MSSPPWAARSASSIRLTWDHPDTPLLTGLQMANTWRTATAFPRRGASASLCSRSENPDEMRALTSLREPDAYDTLIRLIARRAENGFHPAPRCA